MLLYLMLLYRMAPSLSHHLGDLGVLRFLDLARPSPPGSLQPRTAREQRCRIPELNDRARRLVREAFA